jgi:hypothetical protein
MCNRTTHVSNTKQSLCQFFVLYIKLPQKLNNPKKKKKKPPFRPFPHLMNTQPPILHNNFTNVQ